MPRTAKVSKRAMDTIKKKKKVTGTRTTKKPTPETKGKKRKIFLSDKVMLTKAKKKVPKKKVA